MKTIPQRELRNDNARVIEAVVAGESFVITRNGEPVAELHPVRTARPRSVAKSTLLALLGGSASVDAAAFRADSDAVLDSGLE